VYRIRSNHSNISKKGGANQNAQVCKTTLVKVDRNKYLTLDRSKLGTDEYLVQNAELTFYSASSLKQESVV
jgi:hypothetical protein